jgi:hypothetical protein
VDTRGSLCTISTTFHQTVNASTHLNPGPFTEHESLDRKMRSENHTPRPCAPDRLCVVNMDQNLCLVHYVQAKTFLEGSISRVCPALRASFGCRHAWMITATSLRVQEIRLRLKEGERKMSPPYDNFSTEGGWYSVSCVPNYSRWVVAAPPNEEPSRGRDLPHTGI